MERSLSMELVRVTEAVVLSDSLTENIAYRKAQSRNQVLETLLS